ncbi:MAG: tetratricopeptide repeat protein [Bacteroidales bacterium]|nr:tetratricopeptide repeat protein [Bacteroidales bacterium]
MRKLLVILLAFGCLSAYAQKGDLRRGNRQFRRGEFPKADISYRKALMQDSTSVAATYNLANTLYREKDMENARRLLDGAKEAAGAETFAADYYYNLGDVAIAQEDWQAAVDALKQSLLLNPGDVKAKENYIYARNKLMEQQQQDQNQQGDGQDNQDQNQQDQNQDQNQQDQNQNQDQNQQQDQQNQDQQDQGQQGEAQISPQQAQQMLQAIQQKEKETQEKVDEKKAAALKSRQKEKNW